MNQAEPHRILIKKLFHFSIGSACLGLIGIIAFPLITWLIAPDEYGKASLFFMCFVVLASINMWSLDQGYAREYNHSNNKEKLLFNCFLPIILSSIITCILLLVFSNFISHFLFGKLDFYSVAMLAIIVLASGFAQMTKTIINMEMRAVTLSTIQISNRLIDFAITVLLLLFVEKTYRSIITAQTLALIFSATIGFFLTKHHWQFEKKINYNLIKKLFSFSFPLSCAAILFIIIISLNQVLLRHWTTFSEVGIYNNAIKITTLLILAQEAFRRFWTPTKYQWYSANESIQKYHDVNELLAAILSVAFALLVIFKDIILLAVGPSYREAGVLIPFVALIPIMNTFGEAYAVGINFTRKTHWYIWILLISITINLSLGFHLVPSHGALGAAISIALSFITFFLLEIFVARIIWKKISPKRYLINTLFMSLIAASSLSKELYPVHLISTGIIVIYNFNLLSQIASTIFTIIRKRSIH